MGYLGQHGQFTHAIFYKSKNVNENATDLTALIYICCRQSYGVAIYIFISFRCVVPLNKAVKLQM